MRIIPSIRDMQTWSENARRRRLSIGLVPTMGCLHEGHGSLVLRSVRDNDLTVASIFVNPLQFGPREDFGRYPRPFKRDARLLKQWRIDILFHPSPKEMFPDDFATTVSVKDLDKTLCGPRRPGHFNGVATVVAKLLTVVQPTRAYFGQKDYQQLKIIERLVKDLNLPVSVVGCPIVREQGGLARSSRNRYLTTPQKNNANQIFTALQEGRKLLRLRPYSPTSALNTVMKRLKHIPGARVEYLELVNAETLKPARAIRSRTLLACAVRLGSARLIDNIFIDPR
jgi:pantoate--beta-alanine ligase